MPRFSWCIVAYGLILIASDLIDRAGSLKLALGEMTIVPCWSGGALLVAAGVASAQGRRSLRLAGLYVGILLPLTLAALFSWHSLTLWQSGQGKTAVTGPLLSAILLAAASIGLLVSVARLRPREGIASRGYAIPLPPARTTPPTAGTHEHKPFRSEAG